MFFPLSSTEHKLFIDIYSNLEGPNQVIANPLTFCFLFDPLWRFAHLRKLAARGIDRLVKLNMVSNHQTMWLLEDSLIYMVRA